MSQFLRGQQRDTPTDHCAEYRRPDCLDRWNHRKCRNRIGGIYSALQLVLGNLGGHNEFRRIRCDRYVDGDTVIRPRFTPEQAQTMAETFDIAARAIGSSLAQSGLPAIGDAIKRLSGIRELAEVVRAASQPEQQEAE